MNNQLETNIQPDGVMEKYVFEYPRGVSRIYAVVGCVLTSIAFMSFLVIGGFVAYYSFELYEIGVVLLGISGIALIVNLILIFRFVSNIRFKSRYDVYKKMIGNEQTIFIDVIAIRTKKRKSCVIRDLRRATKLKLVPQGHFSRGNRVFMISDEVYSCYKEKQDIYDNHFQKLIEEYKLTPP